MIKVSPDGVESNTGPLQPPAMSYPQGAGYHAPPSYHHLPAPQPQPQPQQQQQNSTTVVQLGASPAQAPVVVDLPPDSTCPMVMGLLSSIFCFLICGMAALAAVWKARLQLLDKKVAHAHQSIRLAWAYIALAIVLGIAVYIIVVVAIKLIVLAFAVQAKASAVDKVVKLGTSFLQG